MRRLFGSETPPVEPSEPENQPDIDIRQNITNGALDTLSSMFQTLGNEAFPLDSEQDPNLFPRQCSEFVRHIENGEAVPTVGIPRSVSGDREWPQLRNFFSDRRREERQFVTERIGNYREVVEQLVAGLRHIGERDQRTQQRVSQSLTRMESVIASGDMAAIRSVLQQTIEQVEETFEAQRQDYERQLEELNHRMSSLRQDLVAAREEMKRDSLTDAYNRGAFDTAIEQALNMHFVLRQPVTLVMIDCDKFKDINDRHGHASGDQALRMMGECLARAFIRKSDFVARYGGDEFAVLLHDTTARSAGKIINRFVASVARVRIPVGDEEIALSCSVGYTELTDGDTAETAVNRADRGLYAVKARGGSGLEYLAPGDEPPPKSVPDSGE